MSVTFEHRTREYRAGVMLLMLSTLLTAAGYSTGHWVDRGQSHYGLWVHCSFQSPPLLRSRLVCGPHNGSTALNDILRVPRILISMELVALIIACVIAVVVNCRRHVPKPRHRYLEICICIAGLLGLLGSSLFWEHKYRLDLGSQVITMLSWSFHLVFLDSILLLVITCVIACNDDVIPGSDDVSLTECVRDVA